MGTNKVRANESGRRLEEHVSSALDDYGFEKIDRQWLFKPAWILNQPIYCAQYTEGIDIYGKKRRVDFLAYHPESWSDGLIIQCKWQASSGSVEEKYPFEALSVEYNKIPTVIVLDGGGYTQGAKGWLVDYAKKEGTYLKHVLAMGEFQNFLKKSL